MIKYFAKYFGEFTNSLHFAIIVNNNLKDRLIN